MPRMGRTYFPTARAAMVLAVLLGAAGCGPQSVHAEPSGAAPSALPIADPSAIASHLASPRAPVPAGQSRIEIALNDCEGCVVTAYVAFVQGEDLRTWVSEPVRAGRTSLVVPTRSTHAMSFDVQGAKTVPLTFENARPAVVLAYRTPARGKQQGNWCWAGTSASDVVLIIRHSRLPAARFAGALPGQEHEDVFEARPALPVLAGEWQPSPFRGLGHQDAPYCKG